MGALQRYLYLRGVNNNLELDYNTCSVNKNNLQLIKPAPPGIPVLKAQNSPAKEKIPVQ